MSKYHILPFNIKEWWAEKQAARMNPTGRCCWLEWLFHMWYNRTYYVRGRWADIARDARCTIDETREAVAEIKKHRVGRVSVRHRDGHEIVTVICRRYHEEHKRRVAGRKRQNKHRGKDEKPSVTPRSQAGNGGVSRPGNAHRTINHEPVSNNQQQKRTCLCTQDQAENIFKKWAVMWNSGADRHRVKLRSTKPEHNRSVVGCIRTLATDAKWVGDMVLAIRCICVERLCNAFGSERWSWRPTFDWLLKDRANVDKVLSGAYDGEAPEKSIAQRTAELGMGEGEIEKDDRQNQAQVNQTGSL